MKRDPIGSKTFSASAFGGCPSLRRVLHGSGAVVAQALYTHRSLHYLSVIVFSECNQRTERGLRLRESLAFSPDGTARALAGLDKTIRLWDVDTNDWTRLACRIANPNFMFAEWALRMAEIKIPPRVRESAFPHLSVIENDRDLPRWKASATALYCARLY